MAPDGAAHVVEVFTGAAGLATVALTSLQEGCQRARLSRLSLPFLVGTLFTDEYDRAMVLGFLVYLLGGFATAFLYWMAFLAIGLYHWWSGALVGALHAVFLLTVVVPVLPYIHPRMVSESAGPLQAHGIEPPGFLALNYGYATPLLTLVAQALYGAILGACLPPL